MKHSGVSWETAWEMPDDERQALCIVLAEHEGNAFDWESGTFKGREE